MKEKIENEDLTSKENIKLQVSHLYKGEAKDDIRLDIEGLRLFAHIENNKRQKKGGKFECYVMKVEELDKFIKQLEDPLNIPMYGTRNFQVIVKINEHFTALDFRISPQKKEVLVLDAANDLRYQEALYPLVDRFDKIYIGSSTVGENSVQHIQRSYQGCRMFAFDHTVQISQLDINESILEKNSKNIGENIYFSYWEIFPPSIVWNAQSVNWLNNDYIPIHKDELTKPTPNGLSLEKYLDLGIQNKEIKPINKSIERVFNEHKKTALMFLESAKELELDEICNCNNQLTPVDIATELKGYIENYEKQSMRDNSVYGFFKGIVSKVGEVAGYEMKASVKAAEKLLALLDGQIIPPFTKLELEALHKGDLAKILKRHEKNEIIQSFVISDEDSKSSYYYTKN